MFTLASRQFHILRNMAAILLSQETYDRLMKMLEQWEKGEIIVLGKGLKNLETGTGYQKIGIDGTECPET